MAILPIVTYPADILEKECEPVKRFDRQLIKLLNDMYDTMVEADGVGLAAPQVGIAKQIAVVDVGDEHGRIELINPVILEARGEQTGPEGCLSFPGLFGEVKRADYVKVRAQDRRGRPFTLEATGFLARALQHEIDHLHGILFTSKVIRYYDPEELEG
ncbi:peptide deformylase [Saccharococcus caldoxylosilyticus]|uniref:Peptide deformylase n=1 Tax=Parageobacillus caldoxylosilyticus NBRC 107762 TaxID=1220594 RepID=A0A023DCE1_9BACL|nr:peptide deformylase [Parageobacillus caldoxylosilyticus]MBB3851350.1 peptide deformylase [Parageobacillus caldoxylosilyticus]OQP05300.1 peptide deformylase [Geobacillus sp. 44B]QNU37826.1 peptide deformylase [Geobacillus sp. 44B]GAJ38696.1 peptide deformylase [Parageobacillus caldoxylosilyticus NBRC 107762]